jgi:hypothetical protein
MPAELGWIVKRCAADPTSGSLREAESEGRACHARKIGMDCQTLRGGPDKRVPPSEGNLFPLRTGMAGEGDTLGASSRAGPHGLGSVDLIGQTDARTSQSHRLYFPNVTMDIDIAGNEG